MTIRIIATVTAKENLIRKYYAKPDGGSLPAFLITSDWAPSELVAG
jgi:hypothetical protein